MKRVLMLVNAVLLAGFSLGYLRAQGMNYEKYLSAADIEKVTGVTGIKQVPREPRIGAGGHLNFANQAGDMILIASFLAAEEYGFYRDNKDLVKSAVPGVGDEAMIGPASDPQYMFLARKGGKCVALSTFSNPNDPDKTRLTIDQLIAIGKIVIERL